MATVWVGRESSDVGDRLVAVKAMLPELAQKPDFRTMFLEEGQIVRSIEHTHIVRIHEVGEDRGILFIAMEWIQGDSLRAVIREAKKRRAIPAELAVRIIADTSAGLHAAHELRGWDGELRNLVHCDVSPHNILVGIDGRAKLVDFGVANGTLYGDPEGNEKFKGKFGYMSPEQARGEPIDRRSDVFALGIVLFELTTGERLFHGETPAHTLRLVASGRVPNPARMFPGYPEPLAAIVMKALESDVSQRFQTAEEFGGALEQYLVQTRTHVAHASVGKLVKRVLAPRLQKQHDALRAALVAADGVLRAGLVPEVPSDPRSSRATERLSDPPTSHTSGSAGPFHQSVSSWPRARRAPIGAVLFGAVGVASALAAVVWTSTQTKPNALITAPGADTPARLAPAPHDRGPAGDQARDDQRAGHDGVNVNAIPVAQAPERRPAEEPASAPPARGRPSDRPPTERSDETPSAEPPREKIELEESDPTPPQEPTPAADVTLDEPDEPAAPPGERGPLNRGAAMSALASAAKRAGACKSAEGPSGSGRATVTFSPDGQVTSVSIPAPFAGTSTGACVASAYKGARVPAFTGSSVTLPHGFRIP